MLRRAHTLILLLVIVCLLFTACGPSSNEKTTNNNQDQSPPPQDVCPAQAKNLSPACVTPQGLRIAYGIEPLIKKGFTGKGQTIIDITSFDSPNLQKNLDVF